MNIRPTEQGDLGGLQRVLVGTDLFPAEMLADMVRGFLAGEGEALWLTCEVDGVAIGFCYAAPEVLTDGTWNMLALAVLPELQGKGYGGAIVGHLEAVLKGRNQRILIVDTSSAEAFAPTRAFYRRIGYREEARIRDFWAKGDDKVVFWKSLG